MQVFCVHYYHVCACLDGTLTMVAISTTNVHHGYTKYKGPTAEINVETSEWNEHLISNFMNNSNAIKGALIQLYLPSDRRHNSLYCTVCLVVFP